MAGTTRGSSTTRPVELGVPILDEDGFRAAGEQTERRRQRLTLVLEEPLQVVVVVVGVAGKGCGGGIPMGSGHW